MTHNDKYGIAHFYEDMRISLNNLQSIDPERLDREEGSGGDTWISLGRGNRFYGWTGGGGIGRRRSSWEREGKWS